MMNIYDERQNFEGVPNNLEEILSNRGLKYLKAWTQWDKKTQ